MCIRDRRQVRLVPLRRRHQLRRLHRRRRRRDARGPQGLLEMCIRDRYHYESFSRGSDTLDANVARFIREQGKMRSIWSRYYVQEMCIRDSDICRRNGFNVLDLPQNLGIGGAVQAGHKYAQRYGYDIDIPVSYTHLDVYKRQGR